MHVRDGYIGSISEALINLTPKRQLEAQYQASGQVDRIGGHGSLLHVYLSNGSGQAMYCLLLGLDIPHHTRASLVHEPVVRQPASKGFCVSFLWVAHFVPAALSYRKRLTLNRPREVVYTQMCACVVEE